MTLDEMMARMGFTPTDLGPYVSQLRVLTARRMSEGMVNASSGTWADECYERDERGFITGYKISAEERARAFLEVEWEMEHGHSCLIEMVDSLTWRRWYRFPAWVRDRVRSAGMAYRVWRDRKNANPYAMR